MFRRASVRLFGRRLSSSSSVCDNPFDRLTPLPKTGCSVVALGQPTAETHPHLVRDKQCIPGFTAEELSKRRNAFFALLCKLEPSAERHIAVIPSATKVFMTEKIPFSFRQNSNFYYLCGFSEPNSVLVIHGHKKETPRSVLFVPKHDPANELWDGPRTGPSRAVNLLKVDEAYGVDEVEKFISSYPTAKQWSQRTNFPLVDHLLKDSEPFDLAIQKLRLIKSSAEIDVMQRAADITCESLVETIRSSHPFVLESQMAAKFEFECRIRGAERLAYPPVVAGGDRANIIHYIASNQCVMANDMVLMDAGAELHLYASDVTRTWPVNGKFTQAQRDVYQLLEEVHGKLMLSLYQFEYYTLDDLFEQMCLLIARGLQELGIVDPKLTSEAELRQAGYQFCPHHVSHYLGMDVHDTPLMPRRMKLQKGMVVTVEPGIYIPRKNAKVPMRYRGLGLRIEDDVHLTRDGPRILSAKCPRSLLDIEGLFK
ncbi:xaa-Pro aminopeptidase 3 [Galendromus occidentalis]|uniref:Xaa-Pro aminopeptidase 3 n=1 Tax=Galendromus occidentalis TaxID=34638 RepID=A0AAJ7L6A1_9ACAR|nr:xaa-Pro aminopeptidase 3 [Galendromus occidentalis]